jgi:hypothetical protein
MHGQNHIKRLLVLVTFFISLLSFWKAGYSRYIISHYTILIPVTLTAINITPKHII